MKYNSAIAYQSKKPLGIEYTTHTNAITRIMCKSSWEKDDEDRIYGSHTHLESRFFTHQQFYYPLE